MLRSLNGDRVPARGVPPARRPNRIRLRRPGDVGIGLALVENGYRVFFTGTTDLVQRMHVARRELALESLFARLDRCQTKDPHGLGKVVPSASRDRERSRRRARSTQAPADAAPDVTSEVGFWTANYAERLRSIAVKYVGIRTHVPGKEAAGRCRPATWSRPMRSVASSVYPGSSSTAFSSPTPLKRDDVPCQSERRRGIEPVENSGVGGVIGFSTKRPRLRDSVDCFFILGLPRMANTKGHALRLSTTTLSTLSLISFGKRSLLMIPSWIVMRRVDSPQIVVSAY